jgi:histidinol-phosphate aminotransferase
MVAPKPRPGILDITPYVGGASPAAGPQETFKLSSNESALGASPKAVRAYRAADETLFRYPDGGASALRAKIATIHKAAPERIVCGAGSDEILQLLAKAYLGEGDNIIQSEHGFLLYAIIAKSCGAEARFARERNLTADIEAIAGLVDARTRIVFLANPNNPTGTYVSGDGLRRLRKDLRDDILLVIDAAYAEYVNAPDYEAGAALVEENDNVVMTRTFSKIYGLAALRLGWGYCPPAVADVLNRIRGPFNVAGPAQAAGIAALDDQNFVRRNRARNRLQRDWLSQQLARLGLEFVPSCANFVLVKFPDAPGRTADEIRAFLASGGVFVREMGAYGLGECLRITIGTEEANRRLIALLSERFDHGR